MTEENERYPCPKGCGRDDFKTKSAAHAHAVHCKVQPEPGADGLNPSEQLILGKLGDIVVAQVQEGMAGLEQRILESVTATLPPLVAQEAQSMAGRIAEELKGNPGAGAAGGATGAATGAGLLGSLGQINAFLATPAGKLVEQWFSGKQGKGVSTHWLFRGANYAQRMMMSKKTDMESTAQFILATTEDALRERNLDPDYKAFLLGQKNTAKIALGGEKGKRKAPGEGEGQ